MTPPLTTKTSSPRPSRTSLPQVTSHPQPLNLIVPQFRTTHGLKALCFFLSRRPDQSPSTDTLIHLTKLILTLKDFSSHILQMKAVAMGTRTGPSYACLFV
eukprot:g18506.t1